MSSSGGEENDDEDVSFSEPPLDDEDDEPLTRPSSGFSPSPQPLTSTQKPQAQGVDENQNDKKDIGKKQIISRDASWSIYILLDILHVKCSIATGIFLLVLQYFGETERTSQNYKNQE